ncbi:hypothetical protein GCM10010435_37540 [Winogradskya consettensis]|uniref:Uncharacterized protein n=1 Tax=Winogradskya consettensis TaxID=113560 RepID=A0A919VX31_9ACTN|nr:hypothetical protein [Actinoplanes consettensis]GIM83850.1 hypothetical protein Aco04nite_88550 [Actinoplanes consettensis]
MDFEGTQAFLTSYGASAYVVYLLSGFVLRECRGGDGVDVRLLAYSFWFSTKWPALAELLLRPLWDVTHDELRWWSPLVYALAAWRWWCAKDDGDDISKRFRRKLHEVVAEVRGRLVVVPAQ